MKKNNFNDFAAFLKSNDAFFDHTKGTWNQYYYSEKGFREMEMCELNKLAHHFLSDQPTSVLSEYLKKYKNLYGVKFNSVGLFGFSNGVLNLTSGKFIPYSPRVFVHRDVDYPYEHDAKSFKKIKKFLKEILGNDLNAVKTLLNLICLPMDIEWAPPFIVVLLGEGDNGKSALIELLTRLYGKERVSFLSVEEYQDKFKTGLLVNKTINLSEENTKKFNSATLKSLKNITSGAVVNVESKFTQAVPIFLKQLVIFALNKLPHLDETTDAVKRRLVVFRMANIPKENQDPFLLEKLTGELSAFFNFLHTRNQRMKKNGRVPIAKEVKRRSILNLFPKSELKMFLLDQCECTSNSDDRVSKKELYSAYKRYCHGFSAEAQEYQTFCKEILKEVKDVKSGKVGKEGNRKNCFIGIKLKT